MKHRTALRNSSVLVNKKVKGRLGKQKWAAHRAALVFTLDAMQSGLCIYPDCNCPIEMWPENKCALGLDYWPEGERIE